MISGPAIIAVLGAWAYRWVDEDAFINFRIIVNLLGGRGFTYNPGERVEADSDPLWVLTLAVVHVVTPFLSLEWLSVLLGVGCTAIAFFVGGWAIWRVLGGRDQVPVVPLGMLLVAVVPVVWEFSTSGLEMSMVFVWAAWSFLLLCRSLEQPRAQWPAAVVVGLGTLIRPELALPSAVFLAVLLVLSATGSGQTGRPWRRATALAALALALPLAFEVFRMAYYAMVVPNTALAKDAGGSWWSQGWRYSCNLIVPYGLWLPLGLGAVLIVVSARHLVSTAQRRRAVVLVTPAVAGLAAALWITSVGGDYMHGRLLLPSLFLVSLSVGVPVTQLRGAVIVFAAGIVVWAGLCASVLRFHASVPQHLGLQTIFISDERTSWIHATGVAHPITAGDYDRALSGRAGRALAAAADRMPEGVQQMDLLTNPFLPISDARRLSATSSLNFALAANIPGIGVVGYVSGPKVYIFDEFSLANPIGSHFTIVHHARPGHEKFVGPAWMLGRFLPVGAAVPAGVSATEVRAARAALRCGQLASYLHAIDAPLTFGQAVRDVAGALGWTTMRFSADPRVAAARLCAS